MPPMSPDKIMETLRSPPPGSPREGIPTPCNCLFDKLSAQSLQFLLAHSHTQEYVAQQEIVQQGDRPDWLYLILEGQIKTVRYSPTGEESTLRMLGSGDTFMDAVIFMGGNSPINAVALEKSTVLLLPSEIVRQHALTDPQFATNLLRIVTLHYKTAMQQIDSIVTKTPVERLGYYFLRLHLEQAPKGMEFNLPFQKSMIANHLGMTPETFSRTLAQIKKMGITIEQKHISLQDAFALCHFCDPDMASCCPKSTEPDCPNAEICQGSRKKQ